MTANRLLLVTYFFPPFNLTESRRSFTIARAASAAGWQVEVVAPWAPGFHSDGEFREWGDVLASTAVRVFRTPRGPLDALGPVRRVLDRLRTSTRPLPWRLYKVLTFPDPQVSWLTFALPVALWRAVARRPNVLVTSSYPYTPHLVGLALATGFGIPWVVDTRDPWAADDAEQFTSIEPSVTLRSWHRALMRLVVSRATQHWSLTPEIAAAVAARFPEVPRERFLSVTQGYDETLAGAARTRIPGSGGDRRLVIGYAGRFRDELTPAEPILKALASLRELDTGSYRSLELRMWASTRDQADLLRRASSFGVDDRVRTLASLPEPELVKALAACDVLLLSNGAAPWTRRRLTTKVFVYLAAQRPILSLCARDSAVGRFVSDTCTGWVVDLGDHEGIAALLRELALLRARAAGIPHQPNLDALSAYSLQRSVMPRIGDLLQFARQSSRPTPSTPPR